MPQRVLIVEDEPNIANALRFLRTREGFEVTVEVDGAKALEQVTAIGADVVILDVMLPNKSGYDILRDLRDDALTAKLPVLMLTARGQTKDRELAERLGVNEFITKPFSNSDILASVRALAGAG